MPATVCAALQVQLMKHMENSQKEFQQWRKQRERELMTLRRQVHLPLRMSVLAWRADPGPPHQLFPLLYRAAAV